MIKFWVTRFSHPIRGLKYAFMHDFAIRFEVLLLVVGLPAAHFLLGPFFAREILLLLFCWFFIVVAELQNSSIEVALDRVHPERHEEIGLSKDLASASVVWAGVFGLICFLFILSGKL